MRLKSSPTSLLMLSLLSLALPTYSSTSEFFILPNSNISCHIWPCYTLSQVIDNPSQYLTSNAVVVFPPGHHEVSTEGQLVVQNVINISLTGDNYVKTVIQCTGQFGLAFVNITNLTISKLEFAMCGAPISNTALQQSGYFLRLAILFPNKPYNNNLHSALVKYLKRSPAVSLYLVHITNLNIHDLNVHHSKRGGFLGLNTFGVSSIQQSVFASNSPNFVLMFLDSNSPIQMVLPSTHFIIDSQFKYGSTDTSLKVAAGLSVLFTQTTYHVASYIENVTTCDNTGGSNGNVFISIACSCQQVLSRVKGLNCTGGSEKGLSLEFVQQEDISVHDSVCNRHMHEVTTVFVVHISDSYFGRNDLYGIDVLLEQSCGYSVGVKLENITVEDHKKTPLQAKMYHKSFLTMETVNFINNNATTWIASAEGNLNVEYYGYNTFADNTCTEKYESVMVLNDCNVTFYGSTTFQRNRGKYGAAIISEYSTLNFQGNVTFLENEGEFGGALTLYKNVSMIVRQFANIFFLRNRALHSGGAVYLRDSQIVMRTEGSISFVENKGYDGGALALVDGSVIILEKHTELNFVRNHAHHYGGGIFYADIYSQDFKAIHFTPDFHCCLYGLLIATDLEPTIAETDIKFHNNTAGVAGTAIYGGWVEMCAIYVNSNMPSSWLTSGKYNTSESVVDNLFSFHEHTQDLSLISSNPTRVCVCTTALLPDCSITGYTITAYPGEIFTIPVVAVGQRFGTVPSTVQSKLVYSDYGSIPTLYHAQLVNSDCTELTYSIMTSPNITEIMKITVEKLNTPQKWLQDDAISFHGSYSVDEQEYYFVEPNRSKHRLQFSDLHVHIELQFCPLGFVFNGNSQTCNCHPKLQENGINCSLDTQKINWKSPFWINATFLNYTYTQVLVHNHCPFDYCKHGSFQLNMEHPDQQCAFYRSGILCGSCQQNLSKVLGSSNCNECSNLQLFWLIPLFVIAGIALVMFIMLFNLTVSAGSINGLIFYANIIRANQAIYFPPGTSSSFLGIFIAWLNLDFGIETCFCIGLDAFAKTWLQFVFPTYIWTIVILIIVSSHYSNTAAKISGKNAVQVLATLFLLSYAKLLRVILTAFSFTFLEYPEHSIKRIWLYDGNVDYLKGKHTALFLTALLLFLTISIPYTAALLFVQCLQNRSRYRILFWVQRLKPIFDAYTGPYKDKHRYWPGLLLVIRAVLLLISSANIFGDPAVNLLAIMVTCSGILYIPLNLGGIYINWVLNAIEYFFILNLGILSAATLFTTTTDTDQTAVVYTSVSIAFATSMGIILYHMLVRVTNEQQRERLTQWFISNLKALKTTMMDLCKRNKKHEGFHDSEPASPTVLTEFREPLLDSCS